MLLRTPNQTLLTSPIVIEAADHNYKTDSAICTWTDLPSRPPTSLEIKRRVQLGRACFEGFKLNPPEMNQAPHGRRRPTWRPVPIKHIDPPVGLSRGPFPYYCCSSHTKSWPQLSAWSQDKASTTLEWNNTPGNKSKTP